MTRSSLLAGLLAGLVLAGAAVATVALAEGILPAERRSGFDFMSPEIQAMQSDDTSNPGMLSVLEGEELWARKEGPAETSCADCHGDAETSMRGTAARYPAFDAERGHPVTLDQRINICRETRQKATPFDWESPEILALSAYVSHQSRGMPVETGEDPRLAPFIESGKRLFELRQGQLNFSCANCHDDNWGGRLGASPIPQAHPTGYPIYRLEWQSLGSLQRRLRNCLIGVRAEPYAYGSPEHVELELFLMSRARSLPMETPGVRP
jgi:sulfur-oxidizing protein SoxA